MNLSLYILNSRDGLQPDIKNELFRSALKVRYQVYHDEMNVVPENPEKELYDKFDFIDPTCIFLALDHHKPVGTMRLTEYSKGNKLPLFKDFEEILENQLDFYNRIKEGEKFAEASRFTVLKEYRSGKSYVFSFLTCIMHDQCVDNGVTDLVIVANPRQLKLYEAAGFKVFGNNKDRLTGIESPAMYTKVEDDFGQFVKYLKSILKLNKDFMKIIDQSDHINREVVNL